MIITTSRAMRAARRVASAALAVITLGSCGEVPTAVQQAQGIPLAPGAALRDAQLASPTSDGSVELSVSNQVPLEGTRVPIGDFPRTTIVAMSVHQSLTMTMLPGFPAGTATLGLAGRGWAYGCSHQGEAFLIQFYDAGGYDTPFSGCSLMGSSYFDQYSDTIAVLGHLQYGYSFDSPCVYPYVGCASYSGTSGAQITHIAANSVAIAGDSVQGGVLHAFPFREYTLLTLANPERIGRYLTPVEVVDPGWTWQPDTGAAVPGYCTGRSCVTAFRHTGTLSLDAYVNGVLMHASLRVEMPSLRLSVNKDTVMVGDTVEVTTTITGAPPEVQPAYYVQYAPLLAPAPAGPLAMLTPASASPVLSKSLSISAAESVKVGAALDTSARGMLVPSAARTDAVPLTSALPPCLGSNPGPLHCYIVMTQPGRATINGIAGLGRRLPFIYDKKVVVVKPAACSASIPASGGTVTASLASSDAGCPPPLPTLKVVCTSSIGEGVVVRGETITCTGSVTPKQPFTITSRASEGADGYRYKTDEPIESSGEPVDWAGRAVIDTRVTMNGTVTVKGVKMPVAPASAQFTVRARTGSEWIKLTVSENATARNLRQRLPAGCRPVPEKGRWITGDTGWCSRQV